MTQLDVSSRVLSWAQYTTMLSEDSGINCEEDWYDPTTHWVSEHPESDESDEHDHFTMDDKNNFLR